MGKTTNAAESGRGTLRAPESKAVSVGIVAATKAGTLVALVVLYYVIAFFAAIRVVPLTMGVVKSGSGVTLDMPLETVIAVWIVPALFLVALVFTLVLVTMRALWRLRVRAVTAVSRWAFGEETERTPSAAVSGLMRTKTTTGTRAA